MDPRDVYGVADESGGGGEDEGTDVFGVERFVIEFRFALDDVDEWECVKGKEGTDL